MALSRFARIGQQAWLAPARASTIRQPRCWGSARHQVSLTTVLEKADNVLPCYAIIQRQLGAEVAEEPLPSDVARSFAHSITWSWNGKEIAFQGEGRSKRAAKNEAARHVLKQLISEEGDLMDPTSNPMLAQWAIEWLNSRLGASMEMQDETPEEDPDQEDVVGTQRDATHSCLWSCPQLPGETTVQGTARTVAESRRQLMATLYKELPSGLDAIVRNLPTKDAAPQQQVSVSIGEANLSKTNVMHNEVTQQLAIRTKHAFGKSATGEFECTLTWNFYDEALRSQRNEEVTGVGRNKQVAKGKANQQMLIKQGHLPDLDDDFHRSVGDMKKALDDGRVHEVIPLAKALMERTGDNASSWSFFLPEVMRMVLAENDQHGLSEIMSAAQFALNDRGLPIDLWEALLDEASFSMRHYHLAQDALQQLSRFPLAQDAFPGELEQQYFTKYRHLLALERHGGLLHGIQQYELDPRMASSVPLVDVHAMESEKVVLTSIPQLGVHEVAEGSRPLRGSDIVLLIPLEALEDLRGPDSFEDLTSHWQHPGTWLASVSSVKGDPRMGEEVRVHTKRISRFASVAGADGDDSSDLVAPMVPGRQYRLFHIAMETPTARMLSCLRCLTQVQLPAWSDNFEGRKPSYHYNSNMRQILLGTPEESAALAPQAPRAARGCVSDEQIAQNLPGIFGDLTPTQRRAVERAMVEQLSLIQGPPGTGKTHVAVAIIMAWAEKYAPLGERILAVADSNVAADNLYTRLEARGVQNIVRVGQGKEVGTMVGDQLWQAVKSANVVIATCIGSGMEMLESRGTARFFQRVVIDECTQACEPAALVALGRSAEQAVLIGDHNQLPATVLSRAAKNEGLGISLFERMILTNGLASTLLIEQRRMHSSIAAWPNLSFYQSQLVNAVEDSALAPVPGFPWPNPECRVCFVDVSGSEQKRGFSAYNSAEAEAVAEAVQRMIDAGVATQDLCVLTAYLAQRDEIRRAIGDRQAYHAPVNLSIDTVDGYQGMERDIVLFSAARSNAERTLGFLADSRRMNVMLTRARRGVIVFGNGDMLRQSMDTGSHWRSWLDWVESQGSVMTAEDLRNAQASTTSAFQSQQAPSSMSFSGTEAAFGSPGFDVNGGSQAFAANGAGAAPPTPPPQPKSEWEKVYSEQYGKHYYWNTSTNATSWETPAGL